MPIFLKFKLMSLRAADGHLRADPDALEDLYSSCLQYVPNSGTVDCFQCRSRSTPSKSTHLLSGAEDSTCLCNGWREVVVTPVYQ